MIKAIKTGENITDFGSMKLGQLVRIRAALMRNGFDSEINDCETIWSNYSKSQRADWLYLPDNDSELWTMLKSQMKSRG